MTRRFALALALVFAALAPATLPAQAQTADASEMTAEELEALFLTQKTRGLVIAPTGTEAAAAASTDTAAPAETTYVALDKSEQVNIRIAFDFDSAALREDQKPKLATLCEVMKTADVALFRIVGHTDASGSAAYNQNLSLLRAEEVKRYMVGECGVAAERLEAVGVGKEFLFNEADPRSEENRRVEFQALS